jgi:hypothetical protein
MFCYETLSTEEAKEDIEASPTTQVQREGKKERSKKRKPMRTGYPKRSSNRKNKKRKVEKKVVEDVGLICGTCNVTEKDLLWRKIASYWKTSGETNDDYVVDAILCKNYDCSSNICTRCARDAWDHYSWNSGKVVEDPDFDVFDNGDEFYEAIDEFEKELIRCTTCTPKKDWPVYVPDLPEEV